MGRKCARAASGEDAWVLRPAIQHDVDYVGMFNPYFLRPP